MSAPVRAWLLPLVVVLLALGAPAAFAQEAQAAEVFEPHIGQDGKDVVWVPTPQTLVDRMLDLARLEPTDYLIDLGSGDGRTVITAAKRGARALGIEFNADMVALAERNARSAGMAGRASFRRADLFQTDLSKATVVTLFLLPEINVKLRPRLLALAPGTRVVSNSFRMGDWKPDAMTSARRDCTEYCTAYLWIVPAKVAGTWDTPHGRLVLKQRYQYVYGSLLAGEPVALKRGKLDADAISFIAGETRYEARVRGDAMEGTAVTDGASTPWRATRSSAR